MKLRDIGWYPINFLGGLTVSLYGMVPVYLVYADTLGLITNPIRAFAIGGMVTVTGLLQLAKKRGYKLFSQKKRKEGGFTLIELLVVISLIGILSAIIYPAFSSARQAAYLARSKAEFHSLSTALELYANAHGGYPPDADRNLPSGLEAYLSGNNNWPEAPWPGSVYDWDAWAPADLSYDPKQQVYQISIRFCPLGAPSLCKFPNESWAKDFDYYSSVYYCVSGPCRAHASQPVDHPGLCLNC